MNNKRAIIVGGSMGGLFAANLLHRAGWAVTVLEKSAAPLTSRGTGIVTNDGLRKLLDMAGAQYVHDLGFAVNERIAFDRQGKILARCKLPQILTAWSRLLQILLDALPPELYRLQSNVVAIHQGNINQLARVDLASGQSLEAELIVAADGVRSFIRKQLFDAAPMEYAGYVAWRALVDRDVLSPATRALVDKVFAFSQAPGEQILGYPILGSDDDDRVLFNVVWYRKTSPSQLNAMLTDPQGKLHADGIAPHLIRSEYTDQARSDAASLLHPAWAEVLEQSPELILQVIVDSTTTRMNQGRVALIGDAAFVARPHVGQGVTKAAGDALALTQALDDAEINVVSALDRFSATRVPVGQFAVDQARRLGAAIQTYRDDFAPWVLHYAQPENLIRDTAVELDGVAHLPRPD